MAVGNDRIYGNAGNDQLNGDAGHDFLYGGDSNDTLNGGIGSNKITPGAGTDTVNLVSGRDTVALPGGSSSGVNTLNFNNFDSNRASGVSVYVVHDFNVATDQATLFQSDQSNDFSLSQNSHYTVLMRTAPNGDQLRIRFYGLSACEVVGAFAPDLPTDLTCE